MRDRGIRGYDRGRPVRYCEAFMGAGQCRRCGLLTGCARLCGWCLEELGYDAPGAFARDLDYVISATERDRAEAHQIVH